MSKKRAAFDGPFIGHTLEFRRSAAWRALPDRARRVLDRIELEYLEHAGFNNGELICTYSDFVEAGLCRSRIALAIRQCVALGFLEARPGKRAIAKYRNPSLYRLTYQLTRVTGKDSIQPTHEWRRIKTDEDAVAALERAAKARDHGTQPPKNKKAGSAGELLFYILGEEPVIH
jgi:hypothetical protein